ncbi:alpha/beta hydrolase [Paenibacillus sp. FSL M8-0334]|uniref:esterase/lipase family protein n=1 Tax=Paenibacillus sp. FSL M8-0334 TaxID=2921623 RepID=UPI0030F5B375
MRKWMSLLLAGLITFSITTSPVQAGKPTNPNTGGTPGSWTVGAAPERVDPSKPAILFVHGLNSSANVWYENNDMYEQAYNNGYQTSFINLYDITGTSESMWDNGRLLSGKIREISEHFGKKLIVIAHSKGGVDTQAAIVHYGAAPYVQRVITLGSPHHGSQLADLAYSSWAGWLADLIGSRNPGTASMQTSYMQYFRSQTDGLSSGRGVPFYTLAGNSWSSGSTSHFFGGLYLSSYGDNDGVVTVQSAYVPGGRMVRVGPWNHTSVRTGSHVYSLLAPYLQQAEPAQAFSSESGHERIAPSASVAHDPGSHYIRGGKLHGQATETLVVEDGVASVQLSWISDKPLHSLELTHPDGTVETLQPEMYQDEEIFQGAWHHQVLLNQPAPGAYELTASAPDAAAYLMAAQFHRPQDFKISLKSTGSEIQLQQQDQAHVNNISYDISYFGDPDSLSPQKLSPSISTKNFSANAKPDMSAFNKPGLYSITAEAAGVTDKGYPFRRTIVQSVFVDESGRQYGL